MEKVGWVAVGEFEAASVCSPQQQQDGRRLFGRLANTRARSISCKAFFIR